MQDELLLGSFYQQYLDQSPDHREIIDISKFGMGEYQMQGYFSKVGLNVLPGDASIVDHYYHISSY